MPGWRVQDETTAAMLATHVGSQDISVVEEPRIDLQGGAVVLAPTRHEGTVLLITATPRSVKYSAPAPEVMNVTPNRTDVLFETEASEPEETYFGPTNWDRTQEIDTLPVFDNPSVPAEASEPILRNEETLQVSPPASVPSDPVPTLEAVPALPPKVHERQYVATGFLGLEDSAEDDEDLARDKRPWWKRIFTD